MKDADARRVDITAFTKLSKIVEAELGGMVLKSGSKSKMFVRESIVSDHSSALYVCSPFSAIFLGYLQPSSPTLPSFGLLFHSAISFWKIHCAL